MHRTVLVPLAIALAALLGSPARADDRARLMDDAKMYLTLTSYRATMTTTAHGQTQKRTIEFVAPDRVRMSGGSPMNLVSIGSRSWMQLPGRGWTASPVGIGAMVGKMRDPANIEKFSKDAHQVVTFKGNGTWQGQPAHLYAVSSSFSGYESHATVYVLPDHFVHHIETTGQYGTSTIDYSDFNSKSISIQPPV
jgi:outer membrane lipoprotein-sorting protein